ncbi:transcriptional regulator [Desulfolutivibrio sulfoxidireducens]|uniref:transcriptional regulator n=1 Tax=Desulfolutivibrio sulfoxidireducens TaxID=2773299 RepID=UPI00159E4250|nr:transcriptional regulator [Desulfolutivibrio sulfoxidireducens]QLA16220.1 transcriptional regulator [Desulfolutivibrio sulfoxidireducens]QLA19882.1 transcriptional regulator [Desulfolutivibrio sulfoxidireducens]
MYRWLILILAGFILWKLFTGDKKRKKAKETEEKDNLVATGEMVKDPMCGAFVSKDGDIRVREGDKVHYFCSYECRDKYVKMIQGDTTKAVSEADAPQKDA